MVLWTSNAHLISYVFISKYAKTLRYLNLFYVQYVYTLLLCKRYMTNYVVNTILHSTKLILTSRGYSVLMLFFFWGLCIMW